VGGKVSVEENGTLDCGVIFVYMGVIEVACFMGEVELVGMGVER
jgi:hypothetical protein